MALGKFPGVGVDGVAMLTNEKVAAPEARNDERKIFLLDNPVLARFSVRANYAIVPNPHPRILINNLRSDLLPGGAFHFFHVVMVSLQLHSVENSSGQNKQSGVG
jgi:hypothetical protein